MTHPLRPHAPNAKAACCSLRFPYKTGLTTWYA